MTRPRLAVTGGSGRLGRALAATGVAEAYDAAFLASADADVRDEAAVARLLDRLRPDVVLHAAAWTDVRGAERERRACWDVNVTGTRHVARAAAAVGARLVHVSTDYVFWGGGDRPEGGYREEDVPGPTRNHYALTKLVAEEAARAAHPHALVLRTSFRPSAWPYEAAFTDVYTGQDYVDVIAAELAILLRHLDRAGMDTLHLVTERKSVFDLARRRNPGVRPISKREAAVELPDDVSLSTERWRAWKARWA